MERKLDPTGMYRRPGHSSDYQRSQYHHQQQFQNHQRMPQHHHHHHQQQQQQQVKCHYLDPTGLY
ncbi:AT-rich binding protein-like [Anopheles aquasalis]|uniref:AT-rich binding protein-like n=1 Tax=Anopheles aquasalis TaxID=42839 RepID=UPI00215A6FB3|nr:AT-rich binding protein-like [Anopheles aquasalis]